MADIIIVVVVVGFLAAVIGKGIKNLKTGKSSCGGGCGGCGKSCGTKENQF